MSRVRVSDETLVQVAQRQQKHRNLSGIHAVARATPGTEDYDLRTRDILAAIFGPQEA